MLPSRQLSNLDTSPTESISARKIQWDVRQGHATHVSQTQTRPPSTPFQNQPNTPPLPVSSDGNIEEERPTIIHILRRDRHSRRETIYHHGLQHEKHRYDIICLAPLPEIMQAGWELGIEAGSPAKEHDDAWYTFMSARHLSLSSP